MYLGSERKQRALSNKLVGDNLEVELGPFSFQLSNGGEEPGPAEGIIKWGGGGGGGRFQYSSMLAIKL